MTGDAELSLDACARLLKQDKVTIQALDPETREVIGAMTVTVTARDPDGLPVTVSVEREHY